MKKNTVRFLITIAILLAVFSAISFVIPFARTVVFWVAYAFALFAILLQLYIYIASSAGSDDAKSRFYGFPIARVGFCYLASQVIVSIIEMALAGVLPVAVPVMLNIILAALAIIGCITVETMRDEIVRQDVKLRKNISNMRDLQSLSATLVSQCNNERLKDTLKKIADEFRFSDPVSSEKTQELESEMRSQMGDIQQALVDNDVEGAMNLCGKLTASLAERNRICSVNK